MNHNIDRTLSSAGKPVFTQQWLKLQDGVYGRNAKAYIPYGVRWKNDLAAGPRDGFLTPYGSTTVFEDVATFVENAVVLEPVEKLFESVIGSKKVYETETPEKQRKMALWWAEKVIELYPLIGVDVKDSHYKAKLDLLHEHGFLTQSQYEHAVAMLGRFPTPESLVQAAELWQKARIQVTGIKPQPNKKGPIDDPVYNSP